MATLEKTLTTSRKSVSIMGDVVRGTVAFVDEKGQAAGQATVTIKAGKVLETGQDIAPALSAALATVAAEFSTLVDAMVKGGALDPMSRQQPRMG